MKELKDFMIDLLVKKIRSAHHWYNLNRKYSIQLIIAQPTYIGLWISPLVENCTYELSYKDELRLLLQRRDNNNRIVSERLINPALQASHYKAALEAIYFWIDNNTLNDDE